ncbi:Gfo/Idh/MocA family oxidoreductase [Streptomyces sp. NPDC006872]|uniref:Gfo/Idh/MocA family protein n=1 Tax=Streptomyces sp. NPDC006872 TaxID=3155720 RepID=UPI0033F9638E
MIRWGVVGPGAIATGFAEAMRLVDEGRIVAVAPSSEDRVTAFGDRFGIPGRYGDHSALAAGLGVDAVYVETPQARHEKDTGALLEADEHVLCERPFAMEQRPRRRTLTGGGGLRPPCALQPEHRLSRSDLGGGALLDPDVHPVQLCSLVLGTRNGVATLGCIGVDDHLTVTMRSDGAERVDGSSEGNGLPFDIAEAHRCLAQGHTESPVMPRSTRRSPSPPPSTPCGRSPVRRR